MIIKTDLFVDFLQMLMSVVHITRVKTELVV